jgi:hypothetical protein
LATVDEIDAHNNTRVVDDGAAQLRDVLGAFGALTARQMR